MPSPEQIQAAMPAMASWCEQHLGGGDVDGWSNAEVLAYVDYWYGGGVEQFIADEEVGSK